MGQRQRYSDNLDFDDGDEDAAKRGQGPQQLSVSDIDLKNQPIAGSEFDNSADSQPVEQKDPDNKVDYQSIVQSTGQEAADLDSLEEPAPAKK